MNISKRILAASLAVVTVFGLVGCGKDGKSDSKQTTTTTVKATLKQDEVDLITEKAQTIEGLPEMELANKEVTWLAHYPMNPNDDQAAAADLELFKIKYGGKVIDKVTTWDARYDDLASLVLANEGPDLFPADDMDAFPKGAIRGMFQPIDDYIDYSDPLWEDVATAADSFAIKDDHYVSIINVNPSLVCFYNQKTIDENGLDDPAELLANGEWTLDKFVDMCVEFVDVEQEKYGLDGYWFMDAISQTTGLPLIEINEEGQVVSNIASQEIETVQNMMYEMTKKNVIFPRVSNNWKTRGTGATGEGLGDGKTLFIPTGTWAIDGVPEATKLFGDVEAGEIRFVPMPLNTNGGNTTHYISSRINGYLLCEGAKNPEGYKALMYCKRACALDPDITALSEKQRREIYKWDDTMIDMLYTVNEMALENPVFEFYQGVNEEIKSTVGTVAGATTTDGGEGSKTWTETVTENQGAIDYLLTEVNEILAGE